MATRSREPSTCSTVPSCSSSDAAGRRCRRHVEAGPGDAMPSSRRRSRAAGPRGTGRLGRGHPRRVGEDQGEPLVVRSTASIGPSRTSTRSASPASTALRRANSQADGVEVDADDARPVPATASRPIWPAPVHSSSTGPAGAVGGSRRPRPTGPRSTAAAGAPGRRTRSQGSEGCERHADPVPSRRADDAAHRVTSSRTWSRSRGRLTESVAVPPVKRWKLAEMVTVQLVARRGPRPVVHQRRDPLH